MLSCTLASFLAVLPLYSRLEGKVPRLFEHLRLDPPSLLSPWSLAPLVHILLLYSGCIPLYLGGRGYSWTPDWR